MKMPGKPSFTDAQLIDGVVRLEGRSAFEDVPEIVDIRVVLVQGERITAGSVDQISEVWRAELPATDPSTGSGDFEVGDAVAFGWETHVENFLTMTWMEPLEIH
jgi:hypothetical protein